ncbi:MAG: putative T7SS-secreted protein [Sciscionella sp.]
MADVELLRRVRTRALKSRLPYLAGHQASRSLERYISTLRWAQGQAADAIRQWNDAQSANGTPTTRSVTPLSTTPAICSPPLLGSASLRQPMDTRYRADRTFFFVLMMETS